MKPKLSHAAATSKHVMRNACEVLSHVGQKDKIKEFSAAFKAADTPEKASEVLNAWFDLEEKVSSHKELSETSLLGHLQRLSKVFDFWSRNAPRRASNTDLKCWIEEGHVQINGFISSDPFEELDFPVVSFVLFPGAKTQLTIF